MNNVEYSESYYKSVNYASYLERQERYERMMQELHNDLFRKIKLDFTKQPVLDYGCAVGFVVKALLNLNYKDVAGFDVSSWAINWGRDNLNLSENLIDDLNLYTRTPKLMLAFDVFEHMTIVDVDSVLTTLNPEHIVVRIPLTAQTDGKYILDVSERDSTHRIRWTRRDWIKFFDQMNYDWQYDINLGLIYDTDGVMCSMFRKIKNVHK
jgi:2-polyprenyl-3-methyl-5-hydroxy-6-metoxy-1,4-benzoquinol methylase